MSRGQDRRTERTPVARSVVTAALIATNHRIASVGRLPIESASNAWARFVESDKGPFQPREMNMSIHWRRVVLGALLLEIGSFTVLVPIGFVSTTVFLVAVPIGWFLLCYL